MQFKLVGLIIVTAAISGCASLEGQFENVPVCAIGETKAYVISMYGPVGVGSELTAASAKVLCAVKPVAVTN